jgi:hypothetical protein
LISYKHINLKILLYELRKDIYLNNNIQVFDLYRLTDNILSISFCTLQFKLSINWNAKQAFANESDITVNFQQQSKNLKIIQQKQCFVPFYAPLKHSIPLLSETESRFRLHVLDEHSASNISDCQISTNRKNLLLIIIQYTITQNNWSWRYLEVISEKNISLGVLTWNLEMCFSQSLQFHSP